MQEAKIAAVLGAGAWGLTLAQLLRSNGLEVRQWSRRSEASLTTVLAGADLWIMAVSMAGLASVADQVAALSLSDCAIWVSATKGLDPQGWRTPSQVLNDRFPHQPITVLSGPNLSKEIAQGLPAATVIASRDRQAATVVQQAFANDRFRVYTNRDPLGTELGGALKNVIAIAVGACDGLSLGANARSALVTRALAEILRVGAYFGARTETFFGLSGLGDLLATCTSPLSRNYQVGFRLAQGESLETALTAIAATAEGVYTAQVLAQLAEREGLELPIAACVAELLDNQISPATAIERLMARDLKAELV
ncbi:NAD(P)H-dependent glycerol-3-phosphate dehydrogenase [Synechococcus elongatus]|uniref:Glycerol-3-phosphate dehydrogenase [NAD(P)+] n=1 Tax=Synechococcus elongatus PCC 11802 TaxID=2283154 RepID=A0AAT9JYC6_SYNEL